MDQLNVIQQHIEGLKCEIDFLLKEIKNIDLDLEKVLIELDRQFLHAKSIGFIHPRTRQELEFTSKLPKDLEFVLKKLKNADK